VKLDRVIVATNDNKNYYQFWPIIARRWASWGVRPTLIVVSENKLEIDESLGDVYYLTPIEGVATSHQSQIIRFFAAANFEEDVCLISDIDMMCLSKEYFLHSIERRNINEFVVYSADAYLPGNPAYPAYPMCYMAAKGSKFKEIIKGNLTNFPEKLQEWMSHGFGWFTDEKVFYLKLKQWEENNSVVLLRRGFNIGNHPITLRRIDRDWNCEFEEKLLAGNFYVDFHMPRPYDKYKDVIDYIHEATL